MSNILVHVCCRNCLEAFISVVKDNFDVLFYNPNIHPESEWLRRLNDVKQFCKKRKIKFIGSDWGIKKWMQEIGIDIRLIGNKKRCYSCVNLRLDYLARLAVKLGYKFISSTMLCSNYIPNTYEFLHKVAKHYKLKAYDVTCKIDPNTSGFYKQNYCGCVLSLLEKYKEKYGN